MPVSGRRQWRGADRRTPSQFAILAPLANALGIATSDVCTAGVTATLGTAIIQDWNDPMATAGAVDISRSLMFGLN